MLSNVSENILKQGNLRNDAPSDEQRKISSETAPNDDQDKDFYTFIFQSKDKYRNDNTYKQINVQRLIQAYLIHPFLVLLFTELQVKYVVEISRNEIIIFAYFYATGTIIQDPSDCQKDHIIMHLFCLPFLVKNHHFLCWNLFHHIRNLNEFFFY